MTVDSRAMRFIHPDLDRGTMGMRFALSGGVELVSGDQNIRQALLLLLTTIPGERVMRPDYGCDLFRLIFSPNDATTAGLAIYYVRRAIERYEPRIDIMTLDAEPDDQIPNQLNILLVYRVRETLRTGTLVLPVNLEGAAS